MNEDQNYNSGTVKPYKATGNLNTAIGNPSVNINDTMNMNIQSMVTNTVAQNNNQNNSSNVQNTVNINVLEQNTVQNKVQANNIGSTNNNNQTIMQNTNYVTKTYVSADNRPKKKTLKLNLGPEFKIVLLIMVILLVFVFILPIISEIFIGY